MNELLKMTLDDVLKDHEEVYTHRQPARLARNENEVYEKAKGIVREAEVRFREAFAEMDYDTAIKYICEKLRY